MKLPETLQGTTKKNKPVTIAVLTNNTDSDGDPLTITSVGAPTEGGTATKNADGSITYEPKKNFTRC